MALVAPGFTAGWIDPIKGAQFLFNTAGWIYRRCNEVLAETDLDPIKIYDLAGHCVLFRQEANKWISAGEVTQVLSELVRLTLAAGVSHATKTPEEINTDYKQLYTATGVFETWATANLPGQGQPINNPIVTVNRTWPNTDFTVRVAKAQAVQNQVQTLRDVFV